jgi:hypothetical protein
MREFRDGHIWTPGETLPMIHDSKYVDLLPFGLRKLLETVWLQAIKPYRVQICHNSNVLIAGEMHRV